MQYGVCRKITAAAYSGKKNGKYNTKAANEASTGMVKKSYSGSFYHATYPVDWKSQEPYTT
jgi:hypothetical protein